MKEFKCYNCGKDIPPSTPMETYITKSHGGDDGVPVIIQCPHCETNNFFRVPKEDVHN